MKQRRLSSVFTTNYSEGEFHDIEVQVLLRNGLPRFDIIGLPQQLIKEGRDRILSGLSQLGIELPAQKILVNLRPGSIPKQGSHFDLPILAAILKCLGLLPGPDHPRYFWGELGLDGDVREFEDFLPHYLYASRKKTASFTANSPQETLKSLAELISKPIRRVETIEGLFETPIHETSNLSIEPTTIDKRILNEWIDEDHDLLWDRLKGTEEQFKLWTMAAFSRLHLLTEGPPGCGKSTWVSAMRDLMPPLSIAEWPKRMIGSHCQARSIQDLWKRPLVAPHHSSSRTSIVGGGSDQISPGALSQAHLGALFLDEIAEFSRDVVEALREPLETKQITIARGASQKTLPADTQILAAMNPCRCGRFGSKKNCLCTTASFHAYRNKISEPLKDRFHLTTWWKFIPKEPDSSWSSREIKVRSVALLQNSKISMAHIELNPEMGPRKQRLWIEFFKSWCLWTGIHEPNQEDQKKFEEFINFFKGEPLE